MLLKRIKISFISRLRKLEEHYFGRAIMKNSERKSPDFMIIGVTKAGTTSLFQYLSNHPAIMAPVVKEPKYFHSNQAFGLRWYLSIFPTKKEAEGKLTFEASPTYLYKKQSPERIARLFPKMKFIVILRDPVKRTFSHWNYYHDQSVVEDRTPFYDDRSFEEAVSQELSGQKGISDYGLYLYKSMYAKHLKHWYQFYPPENILLLDFDELKKNPKSLLKKITDFLAIEPIFDSFIETQEKLKGFKDKKDEGSKQEIKQYNTTPYKERISKEMEAKLRSLFEPYDKELETLTGRKFSWMD